MSDGDAQRSARGRAGAARATLVPLIVFVLAAAPARASDLELLSVGVRLAFDDARWLGSKQAATFRAADIVTSLRLRWEEQLPAGWAVDSRLLASAGVLQVADQTGLVLSLVPALAVRSRDRRFSIDLGGGAALLSRHQYAQHEFGGAFQFVLMLGFSFILHERIELGYRFVHYSDAKLYGEAGNGAEFQTLELSYRF